MPIEINAYGAAVLVALLLGWGLETLSALLNLRCLRTGLPEEFRGVWDAEAYRRSQDYERARGRLGLASSTAELAALLGFWLLGGFPWLDGLARRPEWGSMPTGLLFIGALVLLRGALSLPFSIYATFVLEQRFGFNRTRPRTFILDRLKALVLGALLLGPLLAAILWLLEHLSTSAWLWCWGATTIFGLAAQLVVPRWILPLFNRFTPLEDGPLRQRLLDYAGRVRFPLGRIFVVDGSRRSAKTNAFFAGFGASRRLALFDTLIARHPVEELVAVVAHEVGHWRRRHVATLLALGVAQSGALFFLLSCFLGNRALAAAFGVAEPTVYCGLVFFGLLYAPIELLLALGSLALSRRHELEADRFAAETASAPAMADALLRLSRDNLTNLRPHPFSVVLHHSHPPILERLRALRRLKLTEPQLR